MLRGSAAHVHTSGTSAPWPALPPTHPLQLQRSSARSGTTAPELSKTACLACLSAPPTRLARTRRGSRHLACSINNSAGAAGAAGPAEKAAVVEYLWLLRAAPSASPESMEVLLDSLWSLQYMVPAVMCASAGTVSACTVLCSGAPGSQPPAPPPPPPQQQQQQQDPAAQAQAAQLGFTHAVHYRLSDRAALERFLLHPLVAALQDQVTTACAESAHVVYEGRVAKRLEALFRRGDEYADGVDLVLLLQPAAGAAEDGSGTGGVIGSGTAVGAADADAFLARLAALAESSVAGGVQASHGAVISCAHAAATHVLMARFTAASHVEALLATPALQAVLARDPRVPVVAACSLRINTAATEASTSVDGGPAAGGGGATGGLLGR